MRDFIILSRVFVLMAFLAVGALSCSEESIEPTANPGKITAEVSEIDLYAMKGQFEFAVVEENKDVALDVSKFVYSDMNISYEGEKANVLPFLKKTSVDYEGKTLLVFEYDFSGCSYVEGSFVVGYAGTETAMRLNIRCQDVFRMQKAPILPDVKGKIYAEKRAGDFTLPDGLFESLCVKGGFCEFEEHLGELNFKNAVDGFFEVSLNKKFAFTDSEVAQGYAELRFGQVIASEESSNDPLYRQYVVDNVRIYPSEFDKECIIPANEPLHSWDISKVAEALGIEKKADGFPAVSANTINGYIAKGEGFDALIELRKFSKSLFLSTGVGYNTEPNLETGELVQKECPIVILRGISYLEPGRYNFVVRAKKFIDAADEKYVDMVFPFIKE